ncbi:hypothetical protein BBK36DRAFT_1157878 [Trichoderma citrinoviride]|uniref:Uncharacterized protein n=1 Tax=Trichoderma citrinoviride TaxID=58853 RepID=A0A2T4BFW4_9HYPO|nr:hypothetical protein BBK36DRAFT_1157878 [Trichoderma citrinoviride]PTB68205.1 hypothetical protein BBK36DRAFT_1157878 [Trichoderma citrinoviride]
MASLQTQPSGLSGAGKLTKSRSRIVVKPILKRLHHVHSHSERNSLDLNRGWDDQPVATTPELEYGSFDFGARDLDDLSTDRRLYSTYAAAPAAGAKLARDVSFTSLSKTDLKPTPPGLARANTFSFSPTSHARSTSGNSVTAAAAATTRAGSFVHPFQQMPRTSTPPLHSYANSLSSLEGGLTGQQQRDLTSAIAETSDSSSGSDDDRPDLDEPLASPSQSEGPNRAASAANTTSKKLSYSSSLRSNSPSSKPTAPPGRHSLSGRPSLSGSQRTSSDGPSVRAATTRSNSGPSVQRLTQAAAVNHTSAFANDSSSANAASVPLLISTTQQKTASNPVTSTSPISPFRTSLDMNGFRLRSRSEMDSSTRQEQVREARRKFEAKEKEKEEKYAREQIKKRERADAKEAHKMERAQAQKRKTSFGYTTPISSARNSSSVREKTESDPLNGGQAQETPSRSKSAKRRTNSLWTAFMLWLRTRLLKLARRKI